MCFGSADLVKGFWQIPLTERASKAFAFATHDAVFEPLRVPMGARNGATHFQKCMTQLFTKARLINRGVIIFIDDILLYAKSPEELVELWARVLRVLRDARLYIAPDKVELFRKQIVWCGHLLSAAGVEADPARLRALNMVPEPENAAQLQQFLAAANWIRDKIPNYSAIVEPLQAILTKAIANCPRKSKSITAAVSLVAHGWGEEERAAFTALKTAICNAVRLAHPRADADLLYFSDASDKHWGAALTQVPKGHLGSGTPVATWPHEPLAFVSGTFRGSQCAWHTVA